MRHVFKRVDVGASQQDDILVCSGNDGWESSGASLCDQNRDSLPELVAGSKSDFPLGDWRFEFWEEDFGRRGVPVEVEREGVGVDSRSEGEEL